ncbi:MAG: glycosyltransferase family 4 protein [Fimbriimonadaceae bacterium]|nr:glycosyltransferase family 4 protein [Fimbriimonadaceae bacterium]
MKIALVSEYCPPDFSGGLELSALSVAHGLRRAGHDLELLTSRFRPGFSSDETDPAWVVRLFEPAPEIRAARTRAEHYREIFRGFGGEMRAGKRNLCRLRERLRSESYDVAYTFGLRHLGLATVAAFEEAGVPILWGIGDRFLLDYRRPHWQWRTAYLLGGEGFYRRGLRLRFNHAAFVSAYMRAQFEREGFPLRQTCVVPRGVDWEYEEAPYDPRTRDREFLIACRVAPAKGFEVLVEAARIVDDRMGEAAWTIAIAGGGDDLYSAFLDDLVAKSGVAHRIRRLGKLPQRSVLDRASRALGWLNTTTGGDSFGRTSIEALSMGAPLIASDDGATTEVVEAGVSALLYDKHDASALAAHMITLLTEPERAASLVAEGYRLLRARYRMDVVIERTVRALEATRGTTQVERLANAPFP